MTLSISGIEPVQPTDTPAAAPTATSQAAQPRPSVDTGKPSKSAQVSQLNTPVGQHPSQIAETLGIPTATIFLTNSPIDRL